MGKKGAEYVIFTDVSEHQAQKNTSCVHKKTL